MTDDELIASLAERYRPSEPPPCRVCGAALSIQAIGGGEPTVWACAGYEDDPERQKIARYKADRSPADEHYERSRWIDRRQGGDSLVMELIKRFQTLSSNAN